MPGSIKRLLRPDGMIVGFTTGSSNREAMPTVWAIFALCGAALLSLGSRPGASGSQLERGGFQNEHEQWTGFAPGNWQKAVNVRDFIQKNIPPIPGDGANSWPARPTAPWLMDRLAALFRSRSRRAGRAGRGHRNGLLPEHYQPGYLDKDKRLIVGLQTDAPLQRGETPSAVSHGRTACQAYGYEAL